MCQSSSLLSASLQSHDCSTELNGDSFGISPAGCTEVTVVLMLVCASENCRTGSDPGCLLLAVFSG